MKDILSKNDILHNLKLALNPEQLFVLDTVDSTNLFCRELLKSDAHHETLVITNTQTKGRGRLGKSFFSPQDTGIYMSVILDRQRIRLFHSMLTIAAGVAVCRVLRRQCKVNAEIKWVNDIFVNGKKVCGILAESVANIHTAMPEYIIVGIGINISTTENTFPEELKNIAGSVFPDNANRNAIIAGIINELYDIYMKSDIPKLINEYKSYSLVLNNKIGFSLNGKAYTGVATDINQEGNLVVCTDNNETITIKSGEISLGSENFVKQM